MYESEETESRMLDLDGCVPVPDALGEDVGSCGTVIEGSLFDLYHLEDVVHIWVLDSEGQARLFLDTFYPVIYAEGDEDWLRRLTHRLVELDVLYDAPAFVTRTHFYRNAPIRVLQYRIKRPSFLRTIHRKLYAFFGKLEIYHSDIELPVLYMLEHGLFPLARVRVHAEADPRRPGLSVKNIQALEPHENFQYILPPFRILRMALEHHYRLALSSDNPLVLEWNGQREKLDLGNPGPALHRLNEILSQFDPDIILSSFGDQVIFPALFEAADRIGLPLLFDRDPVYTRRKIIRKGSSYMSYGSVIFRAPSYPLFGRWHIDSHNSFVYRESRLAGVIELARLSRLPVQRLARSSTGSAMTAIQTETALRKGYLVPWQKSQVEKEKTALELLNVDKGGLVYEPDIQKGPVFENVIQIDYSQMYPSIMVNHNISPETVICACCRDGVRVPESSSWICTKREGVVAKALAPILLRRRYLKEKLKTAVGEEREFIDARQSSIKWLLVTSFGYLGYRNAKFGKLESHEAVTAFGRQKLLRAKELSEDAGFEMLHAITDCLFIRWRGGEASQNNETGETGEERLPALCEAIFRDTGIEIMKESVYSWLIFVPSRADIELPVANRYFGRETNGKIKVRGIAARRKDTTHFLRSLQLELLGVMAEASSVAELRLLHERMDGIVHAALEKLMRRDVPWEDLLVRRTVTRGRGEYAVPNVAADSIEDLADLGVETRPGEKVRFLIGPPEKTGGRQIAVAEEAVLAGKKTAAWDPAVYARMLVQVYREVWELLAPRGYFQKLVKACKEGDPLRPWRETELPWQ